MDFTMEFNWIQNRTYMLPLPTNDSQIHAAIVMNATYPINRDLNFN